MSDTEHPAGDEPGEVDEVRIFPNDADREAVSRVVEAGVQLRQVRLIWSHTSLKRDPTEFPDDWVEDAYIAYEPSLVSFDKEEREIVAMFFGLAHYNELWAQGELEREPATGPDDEPDDVEVAARFILEYEFEREIEEGDVQHFCAFNATFNAWPYWREFVQSATSRMGVFPNLTIPVFRVQKLARQNTADEGAPQT